jgi:hypothetical protein
MKLTEIGVAVNISGTSLIGTINTTYGTLVEKLGEPTYTGDIEDKVQAEWSLEFEDEETGETIVASIYDWKNYEYGIQYGDYDWHIGGQDYRSLHAVQELLGL